MILIAICDDERGQRMKLSKIVRSQMELRAVAYRIEEFDSGEALLRTMPRQYDIIFLDIEMKQLGGMETAKEIRKTDSEAMIIFVTAYPDFVFQGYDVNAFHYILKPLKEEKIVKILLAALAKMREKQEHFIVVELKSGSYKLDLNKTLYFQSDKRFVNAVTTEDLFTFYGKLSDLEDCLPSCFVRIHQRYLINIHFAERVQENTVFVKGEKFPISRRQKQKFLIAFAQSMLNG